MTTSFRLRTRCIALIFSLAAAGCVAATPSFDDWAESFAQEWVRADPRTATRTQYLPAAAQDAADRELSLVLSDGMPILPAERTASVARARRGLVELERFPRPALTPVQRISAASMEWQLKNWIRSAESADQRYVFEQFRGAHLILIAVLTESHPLRTPRDVENYLARLERVGPLLDRAIEEAEVRAQRGVRPPRFILTAALGGIDKLLAPDPAKNVLVDTLARGAEGIALLPVAGRTAAISQAEKIVREAIRPAFKRIHAHLTAQLERATDEAGAWKLPRGADYYRSSLATFTTTALSADEIHAIGLREAARVEAEMDKLLRELGYTEGSVQSRYLLLQASLLAKYGGGDPRPAIIAEIQRWVRDAEKRAADLFDLRPKSPVEVWREPAFTEPTAAARYTLPAPDGTRPGIYWIPLGRLTPDVIWIGAGTRSVTYHEAVPGHHFQLALRQESQELPRFRKLGALGGLSAFSEGWGLYAERIADEAGWYEGDIPGRLGYLSFQLLRARRLIVDTGLHAKKWSRQQALDVGIQASEIDRYIVWPGQACSYMIGQLRIVELREKARVALGSKFSVRQFHNILLRTGEVPLDVLAEVVDAWIAETK